MTNTNKLKGAIYAAGYTVRTLAAKLAIPEVNLSSKVNGHRSFNDREKAKLKDLLQLSCEDAWDIFF